MGKDFVVGHLGDAGYRTVFGMGNGRANEFVNLTEAVAEWYLLPAGISDTSWDEYVLDEEYFCPLVEAVFADPVDLLAGWAQYAAAMYEGVRHARCQWMWTEESLTQRNFRLHFDSNDDVDQWGEAWQRNTFRPPPGAVQFVAAERLLYVMPRRRAEMFIGIAELVAQSSGQPPGMVMRDATHYDVQAEAFCALVEVAVSRSTDWFCPWAQYAAAIYEVIQGKWYNWIWEPRSSPACGFTPVRQPELAPQEPSGKTIAWGHWQFWQERAQPSAGA